MAHTPSKKITRMEAAIQAILQYFAGGNGFVTAYGVMALTDQCHTTSNATLRKMVAQGYCILQQECKPAIFHVSPPVRTKLEAGEAVMPEEARGSRMITMRR